MRYDAVDALIARAQADKQARGLTDAPGVLSRVSSITLALGSERRLRRSGAAQARHVGTHARGGRYCCYGPDEPAK